MTERDCTNAFPIEGKVNDFEALRSSGLLWLINASVFHPRGLTFALTYDNMQGEGEPIGWSLERADGDEPVTFADTPDVHDAARRAWWTLSGAIDGDQALEELRARVADLERRLEE